MKTIKGKYFIDARLFIDVKNKTAKIGYPKGNLFNNSMTGSIIAFWSGIWIPIMTAIISIGIVFSIDNIITYPIVLASFLAPILFFKRYYNKFNFIQKMASFWFEKVQMPKKGDFYFSTKNIKGKEFILPIFKNWFLEYEATGDFGKYLDKINITELPYKYNDNKKGKRNSWKHWQAAFKFTKHPSTGQLKLWFT